jgi:hypothetical protein
MAVVSPRTHPIVLVLAFSLFFAAAANARAQDLEQGASAPVIQRSHAESEALQQRVVRLVPTPPPAQAVAGERTFYFSESLFRYMDGGADVYLLYDVQILLHQEFKAKEVDVTVDIFDMGTPENAYGIYASERSPNYKFVSIGTEGYRDQGIVNFLQGRYYVKLAAFGPAADAVLDQFAHGISGRIVEKPELPLLLQLLPAANRNPHSEQYLLQDPLGHAFLGPAYLATYGSANGAANSAANGAANSAANGAANSAANNPASTLLISVALDNKDAQDRLNRLAEHLRKTGECKAAPDLGASAIRGSNSFEGRVIAAAKGKYVIVVFSRGQAAESIMAVPILKDALLGIEQAKMAE